MRPRLPKGHLSCLDPAFRYTPAAKTDLAKTFARLERKTRALAAAAPPAAAPELKPRLRAIPGDRA